MQAHRRFHDDQKIARLHGPELEVPLFSPKAPSLQDHHFFLKECRFFLKRRLFFLIPDNDEWLSSTLNIYETYCLYFQPARPLARLLFRQQDPILFLLRPSRPSQVPLAKTED